MRRAKAIKQAERRGAHHWRDRYRPIYLAQIARMDAEIKTLRQEMQAVTEDRDQLQLAETNRERVLPNAYLRYREMAWSQGAACMGHDDWAEDLLTKAKVCRQDAEQNAARAEEADQGAAASRRHSEYLAVKLVAIGKALDCGPHETPDNMLARIQCLKAERDDYMAQILGEPGAADVDALRAQIARQAETITSLLRENDRLARERGDAVKRGEEARCERDAAHERIRQLDTICAELRAGLDTSKAGCIACPSLHEAERKLAELETGWSDAIARANDAEARLAQLTQDLATSRRHAQDLTRERDQARQEAAGNLADLDRSREAERALMLKCADERQRASKAWEEGDRLKGIICNLDRLLAAAGADAALGRQVRAMPQDTTLRSQKVAREVSAILSKWYVRQGKSEFWEDTPEDALTAAGVTVPVDACGGGGCGGRSEAGGG